MNYKIDPRKLIETALLLAMGIVLSFVKIYTMPWGGSVTLCSMFPIILISYRYGVRWGLFSSFVYAILQMVIDISSLKAYSPVTLVGSLCLDYLLGFGILGIGGLFRKVMKNPSFSLAGGATIAILGRYLCSFLSGLLLWGSYAEDTLRSLGDTLADGILNRFSGWGLSAVYSAIYNAMYMLPELIATVIVCVLVATVPMIAKRMN